MDSDVPQIIKTPVSRKRYVHEKLFNQMFIELWARQCEKPVAIDVNSEYAEKFGSKYSQNADGHAQKLSANQFKLHGEHSDAISFWNTAVANGRVHFKQYHPLTKLNGECLDEQWR